MILRARGLPHFMTALGALGQAHHAHQRNLVALVSIVKAALVEDRQERVENGAVGFENLVHKCYTGFRQITVGLPHICVILQLTHGKRPKQLLQQNRPNNLFTPGYNTFEKYQE